MARGAATFALMPPPAPHGAPCARSYICVAFLLRRLRRDARVREPHGHPVRRARYRDGDVGRRAPLRCNVPGRRTPFVDGDSKHSANTLDSCDLDAVAAR